MKPYPIILWETFYYRDPNHRNNLIIAKHKLTPAEVTPMPLLHLAQNSLSKSTINPSKTINRPTYDAKGIPQQPL